MVFGRCNLPDPITLGKVKNDADFWKFNVYGEQFSQMMLSALDPILRCKVVVRILNGSVIT